MVPLQARHHVVGQAGGQAGARLLTPGVVRLPPEIRLHPECRKLHLLGGGFNEVGNRIVHSCGIAPTAAIGNNQSVWVAVHDQGDGLRRGDHGPAGPGIEAELLAILELRLPTLTDQNIIPAQIVQGPTSRVVNTIAASASYGASGSLAAAQSACLVIGGMTMSNMFAVVRTIAPLAE